MKELAEIILKISSRWLLDKKIREELATHLNRICSEVENKNIQFEFLFGEPHTIASWPITISHTLEYLNIYQPKDFIISFTAGSLPLNNKSFPRGIWIGGVKFPILSESHINELVLLSPAQKLKFPKYRIFALKPGIDRRFFAQNMMPLIQMANTQEFQSLRDQYSYLSHLIWSQYFEQNVPHLINICSEEIAKEILIQKKCFSSDKSSKIRKIIFDQKNRHEWLQTHSNLFYGVRDGYRLQKLNHNQENLVNENLYINFDADEIVNALNTNQIFPSYALSELILTTQSEAVNRSRADASSEVCTGIAGIKKFVPSSVNYADFKKIDSILMQKRMSI